MSLRVGQKAPDFNVVSSSGKALKLRDFAGKKNVVLYFYPADFTLVCTKETCGFRDMYADLESKDTEVIGVSVDSDASHEKFAKEHWIDLDASAFYTDSISDLPMLLRVGKPVVVNPDPRLAVRARRQGWPVQKWW